jgi:hypothetical protein
MKTTRAIITAAAICVLALGGMMEARGGEPPRRGPGGAGRPPTPRDLAAFKANLTPQERQILFDPQGRGPYFPGQGMSPQTRAELAAAQPRRISEYRGTEISVRPGAAGRDRELQEEISQQFHRLDPVPPERLAHFQWCNDPSLRCVGWYGVLKELLEIPGGWLVQVEVSPRLEAITEDGLPRGIAFTSDRFRETYEWTAAGLRFVKGEEPPGNRRGGKNALMID